MIPIFIDTILYFHFYKIKLEKMQLSFSLKFEIKILYEGRKKIILQ